MSNPKLYVGTSGYSYKEWKGSFYPADMREAGMLAYYGERFDTVELNNTFYRLPTAEAMRKWVEQVPPNFRFALKAPRIITHNKRLKEVADPLGHLLEVTSELGGARGPLLFGLPPNMKMDLDRLNAFLPLIPDDVRVALEFRHPSWHDDAVFEALRGRNIPLCIAQTDEAETPIVPTADWGYLRLRRSAYSGSELKSWLATIRAQPWGGAFVYFMHEDTGTGPRFARELLRIAG